jgi:hypothetical protein
MQPTSIQAPLHFLFHNAFLRGENGYSEAGTKFFLTPRNGETILVFRTDDRSDGVKKKEKRAAGSGTFCDHFGIKDDEKCSDLLLFYGLEQPYEDFQYRLAFLELKGTDAARGVEQLDRVMQAVREKLPSVLWNNFFNRGCLRALIVSMTASPNTAFHQRADRFYKRWRTSPKLCRPNENAIRESLLK